MELMLVRAWVGFAFFLGGIVLFFVWSFRVFRALQKKLERMEQKEALLLARIDELERSNATKARAKTVDFS